MAITWALYEVFVLGFYWNVRDIEETNTEENTHTIGTTLQSDRNAEKVKSYLKHCITSNDQSIQYTQYEVNKFTCNAVNYHVFFFIICISS